jgi:hypothetical protein
MADTTTTNYSFTKPEIDGSDDTWGVKLNSDLDSIDTNLKSVSNVADASLPKVGGSVTGAITTTSTFDGRDVGTDGSKLDGIATSANNYSHPTGAGDKHIPTAGASGQFLKYSASGTAVWASDNNTTYSVGDGGLTTNDFTNADHSKLNAIEASADVTDTTNVVASLTAGTNVAISAGGTISSTDTNTTYSVGDNGLTAKNFTATLKTKLDGIATSANNYSHPSHNGDDFSVDTGALSGATVVSDIDINVTTDGSGHVTDTNGTVSTRTLTLANLGYTGSATANNYSHPTHAGDDFSVDTGALSGASIVSDIDINVTTDGSGHVTDANGTVSTRTLTLANLGYTGATNANYITNNSSLTNGAGYITSYTNTTYSPGGGMDLSGTTFSVEPDLRDGITHVGLDSNDYINWTNNSHTAIVVNGGERVRIESDGDLHADGDVIAYSTTISDERLKENIQPIEDALSKVNQLKGCTFTYTADGKESAGLIAQDVEKVLPSAVSEKELPLKIDDGEKYKVLQYDQTIGLLVEAIKELSAKVELLENK